MPSSVKLSLRAARSLFELLRGKEVDGAENCHAVVELASALSRATRASATRRKLQAPKRAKKATKREATAAIREAVVARANAHCEACGIFPIGGGELDHFHGRAKAPQSVENCWFLCRNCHREKTDNRPSSVHWLGRFLTHCEFRGYFVQASKVRRAIEAEALIVEARGGGQ